jgi:hypothetical protein
MATRKPATPQDEKFERQDFDLFDALNALDKKDYDYYDRLSEDQQKKFVPYMMIMYLSALKGSRDLQQYFLQSTDYHANKYLFNENVQKHPKLQWLMLCAASPGLGKQFHQWIPNISQSVSKLKSPAKLKDVKDYYKKIYPKANSDDVDAVAEAFVDNHKRKRHLSEIYPNLKLEDLELLSSVVTDEDIKQYERDRGND